MIKVIVIARENECAGGVASVESRRVKKQNKIRLELALLITK